MYQLIAKSQCHSVSSLPLHSVNSCEMASQPSSVGAALLTAHRDPVPRHSVPCSQGRAYQ